MKPTTKDSLADEGDETAGTDVEEAVAPSAARATCIGQANNMTSRLLLK
jgi:hypothetical protein